MCRIDIDAFFFDNDDNVDNDDILSFMQLLKRSHREGA